MPPNRAAAAIAAAWILFWVLMIAVAVQDYARADGTAYWQPVLWESSSMVVATALLLVQRHFTRGQRRLLDRPARWFAAQALWLPLYWLLFTPLAFGIRHAVYALAGATYEHEPWGETYFYESVKISVFVGMFTVIRFGLQSYDALLAQKLRAERADALLRQAQLERLAQQMQPHFLFNALNTVSSLMHSDVARADATLMQLAEVLRAALDMGERQQVPLADELRLARAYGRVMAERHDGRVAIEWRIADAAHACAVPVMSVQPLLENVFKHVVDRKRGPVRVSVTAACDGGMLHVAVADDTGVLDMAGAPGIGLRNLRERLAALHGDAAALDLIQCAPAGVRAALRLPCAC